MNKRPRVIYASDEEWASIRKLAAYENMTISRYVMAKALTARSVESPPSIAKEVKPTLAPTGWGAQQSRDDILNKVNKTKK